MTDTGTETFGQMLDRYATEDAAERERGRAAWAERTRGERAIAAADRSEAARGASDAFMDMLTYGLDNFAGIALASAILVGGLWLAVSTSTGG